MGGKKKYINIKLFGSFTERFKCQCQNVAVSK